MDKAQAAEAVNQAMKHLMTAQECLAVGDHPENRVAYDHLQEILNDCEYLRNEYLLKS